MTRFLFAWCALSAAVVAAAGKPDCSTLQISANGLVVYRDVEMFPNPVKTTRLNLAEQSRPLKQSLCGLTLTADAQSYSIQAKSIVELSKAMNGSGLGWTLLPLGRPTSTAQYEGVANIRIALPDGITRRKVEITGYPTGSFLSSKSLMAFKVNGGALKPFLYNGRFRDISLDPKPVALLELFIQDARPLLWQKMTLEVRNSKMIFTKKAAFPTK